MPKGLNLSTISAAEDINPDVRDSGQDLPEQSEPDLVCPCAVTAGNPYPHARIDRDHLSARTTAAANSPDTPVAIVAVTPDGMLIVMTGMDGAIGAGAYISRAGKKVGPAAFVIAAVWHQKV
ncbi:MAG: hypothetical protein AAAC47_04175 [Pararhizobium sp.]